MYTKSSSAAAAIDSVSTVKGEFKWNPEAPQHPAELKLVMMYSNKESGMTFGTCPVHGHLFSEKTKEAFIHFIRSAEEDFGKRMFDGGYLSSTDELSKAESDQSLNAALPKGLGEGG